MDSYDQPRKRVASVLCDIDSDCLGANEDRKKKAIEVENQRTKNMNRSILGTMKRQ